MIFQKHDDENIAGEVLSDEAEEVHAQDDVETVVGPSVNVEGDLSSNGNIIVKGSVIGSVNTSKLLTVEKGASIVANIKAGNAVISGYVKGNVKIKEALELTSSSKILGDIIVKTLSIEPGAIVYGKIAMPGVDESEKKSIRSGKKTSKKGIL